MGKELEPVPVYGYTNSYKAEISLTFFKYLAENKYPDSKGPVMCCSCTDNCSNITKCACRKKTKILAELAMRWDYSQSEKKPPPKKDLLYSDSGKLEHIRLHRFGIFECNEKCACNENKSNCVNRVSQKPIKSKLQIYDTMTKAEYGLRCSEPIRKGEFIGNYTGKIITDKERKETMYKRYGTYDFALESISLAYEKVKNGFYFTHLERLAKAEKECKETNGLLADNFFTLICNKARAIKRGKTFDFGDTYFVDADSSGNVTRFMNVCKCLNCACFFFFSKYILLMHEIFSAFL